VQAEAVKFIKLTLEAYTDFGFNEVMIKLATRPVKRIGSDELWDNAENALTSALRSQNLHFDVLAGEGAFYGPKIEFHLKDCIGRTWQCGTLQLDYAMPERLGASYIAEDGTKKIPVMLHRAILGSIERFMGILLEHYAGKLPLWLAPIQAVIMNITDKQSDFAEEVTQILKNQGIRAKSDLRNEKIGFKIREHTILQIPYLLVLGDREVASRTISVRTKEGADLGKMNIEQLSGILHAEIARLGRIE
jgi:threonyl-tRNA synthetase